MGWSTKEYFRKFGHDIEMSERRKKRALEDELGKFYRTWGDEICRCYDGLVIEAQALARDDEEITTLAQKAAIYQMLYGFVEKNVWQKELSVGGIAMSRYIYYPGQVLFQILLKNRDVPCSFQEVEAAMEKGDLIFSDIGALTEQVCGTFWQHIMDAIPFYSGDVPPEPEGLDSTLAAAAACYGLTEDGGRAETLKTVFSRHWQTRSRQQLREFDKQVSAAREVLRRWDTSDPEKMCLLVVLGNERERVARWSPQELQEVLNFYDTDLLYEISQESPERAVGLVRSLLDTAGESLERPEAASYLLGQVLNIFYVYGNTQDTREFRREVLLALERDDRFARQVFCSAYNGELLESLIANCTLFRKPELKKKLEGLLEENPVRRAARQESTPPIARPAAKEKPAEPKTPVDSGKLYRYCQVQLEGMEKSYSYLAEDIPVQVGDWVEVPFGRENSPRQGKVISVQTYTAADAPWPPERSKAILRTVPCLLQAGERDTPR